MGLQQTGVTGQTGTAQNDAGYTVLRCVLASLAQALDGHVRVGLQRRPGGGHGFDVPQLLAITQT